MFSDQPGPATDQRHRDAGFTLIELLVVLVILGLLAALVGPAGPELPLGCQDGHRTVARYRILRRRWISTGSTPATIPRRSKGLAC